jgi:hypothetical protein
MASLAEMLEKGIRGWWRTPVNKRNVILEAEHLFSFFF